MKLDMYIMTPEPISTAYLIDPFHQSAYLYVYPFTVSRQRLGKNVTTAANTYASTEGLLGRDVSYAVRIVPKKSRWFVLLRTSCFCHHLVPVRTSSEKSFHGVSRIEAGSQSRMSRTRLVNWYWKFCSISFNLKWPFESWCYLLD
jgi:hypothetical protein